MTSHNTTTNGGGSAAANPQRRNRAALRDYYNLKAKPQSSSSQPSGPGPLTRSASIASTVSSTSGSTSPAIQQQQDQSSLPPHLDNPSFSAESYVAELLKTASLRDILRTESLLVSEIRNLDGERKALVYDNYSKLIAAVGTIAEMQRGMHAGRDNSARDRGRMLGITGLRGDNKPRPGLDGVELLEEKIDALVSVVKTLSPTVSEAEDQNRRDKKKDAVRWVLDAPRRLQALVEGGQIDDATEDYTRVLEMLDSWHGVRGVAEVRLQCAKVMDGVEKSRQQNEQDKQGGHKNENNQEGEDEEDDTASDD